ncbi:succinyl-:3-ketoacid-coenzyme A mitochondrial precursor [Fusarium napiforme]|uniref:Succinyl-:3-ketoacid-coenzyme A mitochondrial n=1 Tax=Fusarium napiforme TaxID=42672 RepID=A0A8H5K4D6_9HYPO|nr:succinyl-:3-ketoacid-coenzyme A mitochondrial precursor [Fusarium napiforme]
MLLSTYHVVPITLAACAALLNIPAVLAAMADRKMLKAIIYDFEKLEDYQQRNETVLDIVKKDTGVDFWKQTRTIPPTSYPPPMTLEAIEKLKEVKGVIVKDAPTEEL